MSSTDKISMSDIYDDYVDYYNQAGKKMNHHFSILSQFHNVQEAFEERRHEIRDEFKESISDLEKILDKKIEEKTSGDISRNLKKSKKEILLKLKFYIYYDHLSSFEKVEEYILNLLLRFYDKDETDIEFEMIRIYIKASKEKVLKFKNIQAHEVVITNLKREIVDKFYPDQLDRYESLSEEKKDEIYNRSNAHKLHVATDWLPDMIQEINKLDNPTHKQIWDLIKQDFPDFKGVPDEIELSFIKGHNNINKSSIDKALTYLFNKKYDGSIKNGTIKRRMNEYEYW